jgi:hypothetical protein
METRHKKLKRVYPLLVVEFPLDKVRLYELREAFSNTRDLLPLGVEGVHRCLIEEEAQGVRESF